MKLFKNFSIALIVLTSLQVLNLPVLSGANNQSNSSELGEKDTVDNKIHFTKKNITTANVYAVFDSMYLSIMSDDSLRTKTPSIYATFDSMRNAFLEQQEKVQENKISDKELERIIEILNKMQGNIFYKDANYGGFRKTK